MCCCAVDTRIRFAGNTVHSQEKHDLLLTLNYNMYVSVYSVVG